MPKPINKKYFNLFANTLLVIIGCFAGLIIAEFSVRIIIDKYEKVVWLEMHDDGFIMNQAGGSAYQNQFNRPFSYNFTDTRLRSINNSEPADKTILTLGDSFTFGLYLKDEETFIYALNQKLADSELDNYKIINGGIGGAGLADWPLWLEEFGADVAPDYILYYLHVSDIERAISKNLFILEDGELIQSTRWKPNKFMRNLGRKNWYRWLQKHSQLVNIAVEIMWSKIYFKDLTYDFNPDLTEVKILDTNSFRSDKKYPANLGFKIFERINNWCEENNCKLIITTTGFFEQEVRNEFTLNLYNALINNGANDIPFYDNTPCLYEIAEYDYQNFRIPGDDHPNAKGAAEIANCTWQWLPSAIK